MKYFSHDRANEGSFISSDVMSTGFARGVTTSFPSAAEKYQARMKRRKGRKAPKIIRHDTCIVAQILKGFTAKYKCCQFNTFSRNAHCPREYMRRPESARKFHDCLHACARRRWRGNNGSRKLSFQSPKNFFKTPNYHNLPRCKNFKNQSLSENSCGLPVNCAVIAFLSNCVYVTETINRKPYPITANINLR